MTPMVMKELSHDQKRGLGVSDVFKISAVEKLRGMGVWMAGCNVHTAQGGIHLPNCCD